MPKRNNGGRRSRDHVRWGVYVRISMDRIGSGLGVADQEEDCRGLVVHIGGVVIDVYIDNDVSATKNRPRPAWERLKADCQSGRVTGIIGWHIDRLTRKPMELEGLIEMADQLGIELATVNGEVDLSTPTGRLMARQLGALARYEVEHKGERVARRSRQRAEAGGNNGGPRPYGFEPGGIVHRPEEAAVIREMAKRLIGGESLNGVLTDLDRRGSRTAQGGRWQTTSARRLLLGARVAGKRSHLGQVYEAQWVPLVDEVTWLRVGAILTNPARTTSTGGPRRYLLSGKIIECRFCGAGLSGKANMHGNRSYSCRSGVPFHGCGRIRIAAPPLEEHIANNCLGRLANPTDAAKIAARVAPLSTVGPEVAEGLAGDEALLKEMALDYADRTISRAEYHVARERVQERIDVARRQLASVGTSSALPQVTAREELGPWWEDATLEERHALVNLMVQKIVVGPATRRGPSGGRTLDEERIQIHWA